MIQGLVHNEDLSDEQRKVAELIGTDNYERLIEMYGGTWLYIPKTDAFERAARNRRILDDFDGYNFKQLARKYSLTEVQIRTIVNEKAREIRSRPISGQTSLFEDSAV